MSAPPRDHPMPSIVEALGVRPLRVRARQALVALRGAEGVPPSRFGPSSLRLLSPRLALPLWAGRAVVPRRVILTNLFNHRQTPIEAGWSVEKTQVEDFRGKDLTYDSHNGTDLAIARGTLAVAPAPAVVLRVYAEYNRGGHKVVLDHGDGLITCSAHLARPLVREGERLGLGQPFALTGYSGLDALSSFPFGIPHIHFNVWLDGQPVDPFARAGEASLWVGGAPSPVPDGAPTGVAPPSGFHPARVEAAISACLHRPTRDALLAEPDPERRGGLLVSEMNYYPTRFPDRLNPYQTVHPRVPRLHLPFRARDFDGVVFADEL